MTIIFEPNLLTVIYSLVDDFLPIYQLFGRGARFASPLAHPLHPQ